jgi:prepilin-type N-terminal cleavage/methylation domain-containing protein
MKPLSKNKIAGFTLIELMIAMAVTMVLLYAAMNAFRDATNSNQVVTQSSDMSDNLRTGLSLIELDLQQAGAGIPVGGITIPYTSNGSTTAPCGTTAPINRPMLGGKTTFPPCNSTLPAIEPGNSLGPALTSPDSISGTASNPDPSGITDEITMLYLDNTIKLNSFAINQPKTVAPPSPGCPNGSLVLAGGTLTATFDATCANLNPATGITINVGDLILFTNTLGNAVLTVTGVSGQALTFSPGDAFDLNGRTDPTGTITQLENGGAACGGKATCFSLTTASRIWMVSYYLDNVSSPPFVRLIRQVNFNTPTPVGETLENLQFTYNFIDGVKNPSNQATVPVGNSESQIRSVDVYLAARSSYDVHKGSLMNYARSNLMTQVSLRSMAYVNRYE